MAAHAAGTGISCADWNVEDGLGLMLRRAFQCGIPRAAFSHPQVSKLEHAKESLQGDMSDARAKLAALEASFQQHLAECSARQAAAAEKEASLELACRHAKTEANIARYTHPCRQTLLPQAHVVEPLQTLLSDMLYEKIP